MRRVGTIIDYSDRLKHHVKISPVQDLVTA